MKGYIKVNLLLLERKNISLVLIPQMTVGEMTQLVLAGKMLHNSSTPNLQMIPIGLNGSRNHIILDFLLTQSNITLNEVWQTCTYIEGQTITKKTSYMPKQFSLHMRSKPNKEIDVKVIYESPKQQCSKSSVVNTLICMLSGNKQQANQSQHGQISSNIQLNKKCFLLQETKRIYKRKINNYRDMEKILLIRQKLLKQNLYHVNIFGQLVQLKQSKDTFDFVFNYIPSIPVSSIVLFHLSLQQKQNLINKLWLFVSNMSRNNYQQYIQELSNKRDLSKLLNAIYYNIDGTFKLNDYTIVLSESVSTQKQLQTENEQLLLKQIHDYVNSYAHKQNERMQVNDKNQGSSTIISRQQFIQIFERKYHQNWSSETDEEFTPVSMFFNWQVERKSLIKWKQAKNLHESSTVKKAVKVPPNSGKKTKKNVRSTSVNAKGEPSMSQKTKHNKVRYVHID